MASTMATARGSTHGIVAPAPKQGGVLVMDVHRILLGHDRRGGLEGHAEVDGLAVGDAALDAAAPVGAGAHAIAVHVELVVVLAAGEVSAREAGADLEALAGGQAQDGLGEVGLQPVEDGLAPARRAAAHRAGHRAAQGVAVLARGLHRLDHLCGHGEVRAADGRAIDLRARHPVHVGVDHQAADLRHPRHDLHAPTRGEELAGDSAGGHASRRLAGAGAAPAAPVANAELGIVRVIGVARPVLLLDLPIVAGPHVLVLDQEADRRAEGLTLEDAGEDADSVGLLALGNQGALPRRSAIEVGLNVGLRQLQQGRAAVHDDAHGGAMRLAPRRHPEDRPETIAWHRVLLAWPGRDPDVDQDTPVHASPAAKPAP